MVNFNLETGDDKVMGTLASTYHLFSLSKGARCFKTSKGIH